MNTFDDILDRVSRPSRYLGSEVNTVLKDPADVSLHMALAFPDLYDIGTSHFGMQILYDILNRTPDIYAERVFAPADDMARMLSENKRPLFSLETKTPLGQFDIIGFSLLYELNYTNILQILDLAGIPFYAAERDERHPIVIAGGPCTVNPEPVADFFDAMVIGDGEAVILEMARAAIEWKTEKGDGRKPDRETLLRRWAAIQGVYVPSFFDVSFDDTDRQVLTPRVAGHERVTRAIIGELDTAPFPTAPVLPFGKPVHDRLRIEVARGCTRGCRFCQAGMIYRPVRERSFSGTAEIARRSIDATGYEDISLLSLSTGDYSCLSPLMTHLMKQYAGRRIAVSIPSFRAGSLSGELMNEIKKVRKTGFTIAPEAGSERLRRVINKNIGEDEIIETTEAAFKLDWNLVKLYFMIGLPTETDEDLDAIVGLVKRLKRLKVPGKRHFKINASVAAFIPKSHTPFQWARQADLYTAKGKIEMLRRALKDPGISFKWQNPETSELEGLFARGDRRLASLLVAAYNKGCRFDGWTDSFQYPKWQDALAQAGIDPDKQAQRTTSPGAPLPWDHIDTRISPDFLKTEYDLALAGDATGDCRNGDCQGCGVCDFETVMPRTAPPEDNAPSDVAARDTTPDDTAPKEIQLTFRRTGRARFLGHLEQVSIFSRAINRAGLPVLFSSGFHPKPRIVFGDALPIGIESLRETVYITIGAPVDTRRVVDALNHELPEGLEITGCRFASRKQAGEPPESVLYRVCTKNGAALDASRIDQFKNAVSFYYPRKTKKGEDKAVDLRALVLEIEQTSADCIEMRLDNRPGTGIRPGVVVREVLGMGEGTVVSCKL